MKAKATFIWFIGESIQNDRIPSSFIRQRKFRLEITTRIFPIHYGLTKTVNPFHGHFQLKSQLFEPIPYFSMEKEPIAC
jgi:hypothetical protein